LSLDNSKLADSSTATSLANSNLNFADSGAEPHDSYNHADST